MFYGFAVAWAIPLLYVLWIAFRERRLNQELTRVQRMLDEKEKAQ
jgi:hypothetical protein